MDLEQARGFVAVVQHGSFVAAATALGMSRPTLSRHIAAFESSLGVAVLHRTTRRVHPTEAGKRLFRQLSPLFEEADRIQQLFQRESHEVAGRLTVSVPPVLAPEVTDLLTELQLSHPELQVLLQSTATRVDLRDGTVDIAIRAGRLADSDLTQRTLGRRSIRAWASASYLAERGTPTRIEDLAHHDLLRTLAPNGRPRRAWPLRSGGTLPVDGRFSSDDQFALRHAALNGRGICLLDMRTAADTALVAVLPDTLGIELELHAVFDRRTLQPARVRAFVDAAVRRFGPSEL